MELRNFSKKNNSKNTDQNEQDFYQKNTQKKFLKIFAAASLALITSATTLLAVAPFGTGAANAAAESEPITQAANPFGIDRENDPVVYTTSSGLQIKYANSLAYLTGHTYFTTGGYDWVIIGYDPSLSDCVGNYQNIEGVIHGLDTIKGDHSLTSTLDVSPAGQAIMKDNWFISSEAVANDEIGDLCVLCICATHIGKSSTASNYASSPLRTYIDDTIYGGTSELSIALQALHIVPQTLTTSYYNGGISTIENAYLFPLAHGPDETFSVRTYLNTKEKLTYSDVWWLRSGCNGTSSYATEVYGQEGKIMSWWNSVGTALAVKPSFVVQI